MVGAAKQPGEQPPGQAKKQPGEQPGGQPGWQSGGHPPDGQPGWQPGGQPIEMRPGEATSEWLFYHGIGEPWVGGEPPYSGHDNDFYVWNEYPYSYPNYYYTTPAIYPIYNYNPFVCNYCEPCYNAPVNCDDGNPCTIDSCSPNGCVHTCSCAA